MKRRPWPSSEHTTYYTGWHIDIGTAARKRPSNEMLQSQRNTTYRKNYEIAGAGGPGAMTTTTTTMTAKSTKQQQQKKEKKKK